MTKAGELKIVEEAKKPLSMNPKKFALWLFIASVFMLFAAWTSAYIVKRADAGWSEIVLPSTFWVNTVIIGLSSISMFGATRAARKDNSDLLKIFISATAVLGVAFLVGQIVAFGEMVSLNEHFTGGNVSHSFMYLLTGAHGVHVVSGIIFLIIALFSSFRNKVHSANMNQIEMCATYWHFLGILWLYLFVFLLWNR
jgi:cytochrome c oxidase subunit III